MDCIEKRKLRLVAIPLLRQSCLQRPEGQYQKRDINGWSRLAILENKTIKIEQKEVAST